MEEAHILRIVTNITPESIGQIILKEMGHILIVIIITTLPINDNLIIKTQVFTFFSVIEDSKNQQYR